MANTFNEVQESQAGFALGDTEPAAATTEGSMDLEHWLALQQQYMSNAAALSSGLGADSVISTTQQNMIDVINLGEAKRQFTLAQAVTNVQVEGDNFIRDSITGK